MSKYSYRIGGKKGKIVKLEEANDKVVVRVKNARKLEGAVVSDKGKKTLAQFEAEIEYPEHDVIVLKAKKAPPAGSIKMRDDARAVLKQEEELRFAGRVLVDPTTKTAVLYTENLFIKFHDNVKTDACEKILKEHQLAIKQRPEYAKNAFFVSAKENIGLDIFQLANQLLQKKEVELCHPELIRKKSRKTINPLQWHLKDTVINGQSVKASVNADKAHAITKGEGIVIAVIDDGVDIDNPEFNMPGKVIHARDATNSSSDPRPKLLRDNHGTACAGVATASGINASGVAPGAKLMPIRLSSQLGSMAEANAFIWAVDHGADIISCSWGPEDGDWSKPNDPLHTEFAPLPDSTRLAMEFAFNSGRGGKGCVITYAAGNGNEDTKYDGYASFEKVIAVAACNDTGKRSVYSDFGTAVWCCFPSDDQGWRLFSHPAPITAGIYTTDRIGNAGYMAGDYASDFGGTSSACPGVAGVVALVLSVNSALTYQQVKQLIKDTCVKIDIEKGEYKTNKHSKFYGYGRVDAAAAVAKALELKNAENASLAIVSAMVNPAGKDADNETITLKNKAAQSINLSGWALAVNGKKQNLSGQLAAGKTVTIKANKTKIVLNNKGATISLINAQDVVVQKAVYKASDVKSGIEVVF
jgi:subtilisin family serine protease